ncbi:unnamed protein product [Nezara viridula]|uniref:Neuropeptide n=1 Tax=Nezara viridula TaxID=85310 RepID=A0A9P0HC20_NEZVI|nr:unnamed protein product [Nezara viridula]
MKRQWFQEDIPLHVSTLTVLLIAWDRLRFLEDPMKPRIPAFVCATGSWLMAICIVLPVGGAVVTAESCPSARQHNKELYN